MSVLLFAKCLSPHFENKSFSIFGEYATEDEANEVIIQTNKKCPGLYLFEIRHLDIFGDQFDWNYR
jgi:hypothetical protein